jgi:hypothetical protein
VIHDLPGLAVAGRLRLPQSARRIRFQDNGGKLLLGMDGPSGDAQLLVADWRTSTLRPLGSISGADVVGALESEATMLFAVRRLRNDIWLDVGTKRSRITSDGRSYSGSLSMRGDLLIQRLLPDGRYVIVSRDRNGAERSLSEGPVDVTPAFRPKAQPERARRM